MSPLARVTAFVLRRRHIAPQWRIAHEPPRATRCTECGQRIGRTQPAAGMPSGFVHLFQRDCPKAGAR